MPYALRGRTVSNDNIVAGNSVAGRERTISGSNLPAEKVGGRDNIAVGTAYPTANIADNIKQATPTLTVERRGTP